MGRTIRGPSSSISTNNQNTGTDNTILFIQNTPTLSLNITHNLNKYPTIVLLDTSNSLVEGNISYPSLNRVSIVFDAEFTGKVSIS